MSILSSAIPTSAQSAESSAPTSRTTRNADDLSDCAQMLDQTIETLRACKDLSGKRLDELTALRGEKSILEKEIALYKNQVELYAKRIEYLEKKKCSTVSIFFLIKWKRC